MRLYYGCPNSIDVKNSSKHPYESVKISANLIVDFTIQEFFSRSHRAATRQVRCRVERTNPVNQVLTVIQRRLILVNQRRVHSLRGLASLGL